MKVRELYRMVMYPTCKPKYLLSLGQGYGVPYVDQLGFTPAMYKVFDHSDTGLKSKYMYLILPTTRGDLTK